MIGPAFTLRYIPAREDLNPISIFRDREHPQRVAVETCESVVDFILNFLIRISVHAFQFYHTRFIKVHLITTSKKVLICHCVTRCLTTFN